MFTRFALDESNSTEEQIKTGEFNLLLVEDSPSDALLIEAYVIEGLLAAMSVEREQASKTEFKRA